MKNLDGNNSFLTIINSTPLVSIDFIIENKHGEILLGKRVNRPALGFWFVPGGRIKKNEIIESALRRISKTETGVEIFSNEVTLVGAYDHIYEDNYFGKEGVNTHYVVLAFSYKAEKDIKIIPDEQHSEMRWWSKKSIIKSPEVHANTKEYFL